MAYVEAVCISKKKGTVKKAVLQVVLKPDWGIESDAHAGKWHRQISLLAGESIDQVKKLLPQLKSGVFAENIVTRGIDLPTLHIGDVLRIDTDVVLEITQIGKECHNEGCVIKKKTGDCIMPREGVFAKVLQGGKVKAGSVVILQKRENAR